MVVCMLLFPLLDSCRGSWRGFLSAHRPMFLRTLALTSNRFSSHHALPTSSLIIISLCVFIARTHTESPQMDVCIVQSQSSISILPFTLLHNPTFWHRIGLPLRWSVIEYVSPVHHNCSEIMCCVLHLWDHW